LQRAAVNGCINYDQVKFWPSIFFFPESPILEMKIKAFFRISCEGNQTVITP